MLGPACPFGPASVLQSVYRDWPCRDRVEPLAWALAAFLKSLSGEPARSISLGGTQKAKGRGAERRDSGANCIGPTPSYAAQGAARRREPRLVHWLPPRRP
jgi:hypothetical protein